MTNEEKTKLFQSVACPTCNALPGEPCLWGEASLASVLIYHGRRVLAGFRSRNDLH